MTKIVFISDYFLEGGISGGAEACNHELMAYLGERKYDFVKINSARCSTGVIENYKNCFFIIANFMLLPESSKSALTSKRYIIYEHDHKYIDTNDPSKFINMLAPESSIINYEFYKHAQATLCQSKIHAGTLQKNLLIDHVINLGGNVWSDEKLDLLESKLNIPKEYENSIMLSGNKNKGTPAAITYCTKNNLEFNGIESCGYEEFINQLAKTKNFIFFPQWLESFNRVTIEARILGCRLITNNLIGCTSEEWFEEFRGKELISFLRTKREEICDIFSCLIEGHSVQYIAPIKIPKISIIISLYDGQKYIEHFMQEVLKQSVFSQCELLFLDANSPGEEGKTISKYMDEYDNIFYKRFDTRLTVQETMNRGLEMSKGEFITIWNVDDTRAPEALEILSKSLVVDPSVDLVYADTLQTSEENETFSHNSSNGMLYKHSIPSFSPMNMIKCLPGPLPMWRRELNEKYGIFDEGLKYSGDWDMWLRAVSQGAIFKKLDKVLGLYYSNPDGLSTSSRNQKERFKEERCLFNKYRGLFGEKVFAQYDSYFNGLHRGDNSE